MTYHKLLPFLVAAILLWGASAGYTQDKQALVEKLFQVSDLSRQIKLGTETASASILTRIRQSNPDLSDDTSQYVRAKIEVQLTAMFEAFMKEKVFPVIENDYSVEELQYMIDFYSSPTGKKLVEKTPVMMQQVLSQLPQFLQQYDSQIRDTARQAAAERNYKLRF